ncbi:MAG: alpha-galactosidase [Euzebyaceae bacterium]|nr:alpha-galactosidase [Euzebyaceae bacterium]
MTQPFAQVAEVAGDPARARVYEHGWQSWSPAGLYPATSTSPRPRRPEWLTMGYRPGRPAPGTGFQGEGLLAVLPADGPVRLWAAPEPGREIASIRVRALADRLVVESDGPVVERSADRLGTALAGWADDLAAERGAAGVRSLLAAWCSWYCYWADVSEQQVLANLAAIDRLGLDVGTIQVDDGHQAEIGDWVERSPRFGPFGGLVRRIRDTGRAAGVWTAPFLVGARSRLAAEHPDWLVGGAVASPSNWEQETRVLDVTHPDAAEHLRSVYATLREEGFTYHKIDFLYAGAMDGVRRADCSGLDAYAEGLRLIREGIGEDATLLGCGAPLLPSVGLVDAMRISPDVGPDWEPLDGDVSQPGGRSAVLAGRARTWMHGRFWVNDPDCLIVRPAVERRDEVAANIAASGGLAVSSDPLDALDDHGLALTRALLRPSSAEPVAWDAAWLGDSLVGPTETTSAVGKSLH